jgi:isoamylase
MSPPSANPAPPGSPWPLGATLAGDGVNFAVFSQHGTAVTVCLFDSRAPAVETARHQLVERTGDVFHGHVAGVQAGALYGLRVEGPFDPRRGHLFNPAKLLIDPYARALAGAVDWSGPLFEPARTGAGPPDPSDSAAAVPRSVVLADDFDWGGDALPRTPWRDTVLYELHVRGFTRLHPDVPEALRGTYAGLGHPAVIAHLQSLGVTAVELLPIQHRLDEPALVRRGLTNYWGYNTVGFFAVEPRLAAARDPAGQVREFKEMVKALHRAGLEVILDVVYNHTAEGGAGGPTLCWRGLDNAVYYHLDPADLRRDVDFAGTGNSLNVGAFAPFRMVLDSLRHWVGEMHVDGFRFDLAPELARCPPDQQFRASAPFMQAVQQDPLLGRCKLIAEPWDLGADGYRLGQFPAPWSEWNDRFRDGVRRFWRGDGQLRAELERRLLGSPDLFQNGGRHPRASVNHVTCHDGFTLADLVSYERKHNEANGEDNRDGAGENSSTNHGVEGPTAVPQILATRDRHARNLLATLLLSRGVPMLLAGDERLRTQDGNNNAYCHDSPLSWVDWTPSPRAERMQAHVRALTALRRRARHLLDRWPDDPRAPELRWLPLQTEGGTAPAAEAFAYLLGQPPELLVIINGSGTPASLTLAPWADSRSWRLALDTSDAPTPPGLPPGTTIAIPPQSVMVLDRG